MKLLLGSILFAFLLCVPVKANVVAYSTLESGDPLYASTGWTTLGLGPAMLFTPNFDTVLDRVELGLSYLSGPNTFLVLLMPETGRWPDAAAQIESWTTPAAASNSCCAITTLQSTLHPLLLASNNYWLWILSEGDDTQGIWNYSTAVPIQYGSFLSKNGPPVFTGTTRGSAFAIVGTAATPEPSSFYLACSTMTAILLLRRGLNRARPTKLL